MKFEVLGALICEDEGDFEGVTIEVTVRGRKLSVTYAKRCR